VTGQLGKGGFLEQVDVQGSGQHRPDPGGLPSAARPKKEQACRPWQAHRSGNHVSLFIIKTAIEMPKEPNGGFDLKRRFCG
jgi:hypothetical protein